MRIAFYIPVLNIGGAEKVVINLLNSVPPEQSHSLNLITDEKNSLWLTEVSRLVNIIHLSSTGNFISRLSGLSTILKRNKFDVVISHLTHSNIHCLLVRCIFKFKLIVVEHSITSEYLRTLGSANYLLKKRLVKSLFSLADKIVCVSQSTQRDLIQEFKIKPENCVIIFNPLNFNEIKTLSEVPIPDYVTKFAGTRRFLISVGRMEKVKNHDALVRNLKHLLLNQNLVLLIVGDGTESRNVQQRIQDENLTNHVLMVGYDSNPYRYIALSECLLHASSFEGFGLVLLEAIYLKTPVVSMDFKAAFEVLDNGRFGIIIDNLNGVEQAVDTALSSFLTVDRTNHSHIVQKLYDSRNIAGQYLKLCDGILNTKS